MIYQMYDKEYTDGMYGNDFLEEHGIDVPDELLEKYNACQTEFWKIQVEISKIVHLIK